ncbi:MAG: GNAT family N-acetyltransferase [Bacteroidota bacterium]
MLIRYLQELNELVDYPYFELYWQEEGRIPLFIKLNGQNIGFTLLNQHFIHPTFQAARAIAEFYIDPSFRQKGLGAFVAQQIFAQFAEKWEVKTAIGNKSAQAFWRNTIGHYSNHRFSEIVIEEDVIFTFGR